MKNIKENLQILKIKYLKNSITGNPRLLLILKNENDEILEAKTETNSSIAYKLNAHYEGNFYNFKMHETLSGNLIIEDII